MIMSKDSDNVEIAIAIVEHSAGAVVSVRAHPGSRREGIFGIHAGALKIGVNAAPENGKANAAIARVLAEAIGCKPSAVELISGSTSRDKKFLVQGWTKFDLDAKLTFAACAAKSPVK